MRFYAVEITEPMDGPKPGQPVLSSATGKPFRWSSLRVNGDFNPYALNVEMDILVEAEDTPSYGAAWLRVWGIGLQDISQSADLAGKVITIRGGMSRGLPLSKPAQAGIITKGYISQCLGNWIGVDQTLDLFISGASVKTGVWELPVNLVLNWTAGQKLSDALSLAFKTAFPLLSQDIAISPNLVQNYDEPQVSRTLKDMAQWIRQKTMKMLDGNYLGVSILIVQDTIIVRDGTVAEKKREPKNIAFNDLIGQPTWLAPGIVQIKCPMRADLKVADLVKLPWCVRMTTTQASQAGTVGNAPLRDYTSFQGTYHVNSIRHVGNFRQPDAASWVSVINLGVDTAT